MITDLGAPACRKLGSYISNILSQKQFIYQCFPFALRRFSWYNAFMAEKKMFATRIDASLLKSLKHLGVDAEEPISKLLEEAIKDLLKKYGKGTGK